MNEYTIKNLCKRLISDSNLSVDDLKNYNIDIKIGYYNGNTQIITIDENYSIDNLTTTKITFAYVSNISSYEVRNYFEKLFDELEISDKQRRKLFMDFINNKKYICMSYYYYNEDNVNNINNYLYEICFSELINSIHFNYLTPKYKQLYLNILITQYTKYCDFVAECLAEPANFGHIYETLKLCIELRDREYIDAICDSLWQSQKEKPVEYGNLSINWTLLQYEAKLSGDMEILRRMKREEFIRSNYY
jgi:hypothetical protein